MRNKKLLNLISFVGLMLVLPFSFAGAAQVAHKPGQLVAADGTVYLIQNGQRLGFPSTDVFSSYGYTFDMVLPASEADMGLPQGPNLKFAPNTLVLDTTDGRTMYLMFDDGVHPIPSLTEMAFLKADGRFYYAAALNAYPKAAAVGLDLIYVNHPAGSLVDVSSTINLITAQGRKPFPSAEVFSSYGYTFDSVFPSTTLDESLPKLPDMQYRDGTLVNDNGTIYLISEGAKFGFKTWSGFLAAGYSPKAVMAGSTAGYPEGESFD
ncbi:MAG: hypothetical protein M1275_03440 [Patescibacteria group bacterium]|nr:hypothetical protein [Patescibacteria group bacterium]